MEQSIFQFKAKPTDHRDKQHAVADFKRALNAAFPRALMDGQFYKIVNGFEDICASANSTLTEAA